jgi:hypothetical protein
MKKIMMSSAIFVFFFTGIIALLLGLLSIFSSGTIVKRTVEHSRVLEQVFKEASHYVNTYKLKFGRLPTDQEFEVWASSFKSRPKSHLDAMRIQAAPFPEDSSITKQFGQAPKDSYLLIYWRGEWNEYYASWVDKTTLQLDESKYYLFGSKYLAGTMYSFIAFFAFICGWRIWRKKSIIFFNSTTN